MLSITKSIYDRILYYLEIFLNSKYWILKITCCAFILSLFMAFPSYDIFFNNYESNKHHWYGIHEQIKAPLTFTEYSINHHSANTSFRLTVPLIAHLLGLGSLNLIYQIIFCIVIQLISLFTLFWAITKISFHVTQDKITAGLICLSFSLIYTGNSLPGDLWGGMDIVGYALLALAILSNNVLLIILFVVIASFNDERALICSCFIFLWHLIKDKSINDFSTRASYYLNKTALAVIIAWIIYFLIFFSLMEFRGFKTNVNIIQIGPIVLKEIVSNIPFGLWTALEGLWLLVIGALLILIHERKWMMTFLICSGIILVSLVSFFILDITRSLAYIFPLVFICLYIIYQKENLSNLRYISLTVLIICLFPTYYVFGEHSSKWLFPFPLQLVRMLTGSETFSLTF